MSQYAKDIHRMLASLHEPGNDGEDTQPLPEEEETIHAYPGNIGGIDVVITSRQPIPPEYFTVPSSEEDEDDQGQPPVTDSEAPTPPTRKAPPLFLLFCLLLSVFVLLDIADTQLIALLTPTVTVTITPDMRTASLTSATQQGKLLAPITVSQSLTVPATGHGHQDATRATGSLTFYNGLFTAQFVPQGTVFTGSDAISIVTTQPAAIPPGNPGTGYGTVTVSAQVVQTGASGNIPPGDINITINNGLLVRNNQFQNGQDARDFQFVRPEDVANAVATLKARVSFSMSAAFEGQLLAGESIEKQPCTPAVNTNHRIGDEARTVTVTVAQTCTAIAYDTQTLQQQATKLLNARVQQIAGSGYLLYGDVKLTITKADATSKMVTLSFTAQAIYVYQLTAKEQQRIVTHIQSENRVTALREMTAMAGIKHVSITGIRDNELLPDDPGHIHLLIIFLLP